MQRLSDFQLPRPLRAGVLALLFPLALGACAAGAGERGAASEEPPAQEAAAKACPAPGTWLDPADGRTLSHTEVVAAAAARDVVLLGESHDQAEHHRWQLSMLAGLRARNPGLVIGFEAFPRRVQPQLDTWIEGGWSSETFLKEVGWNEVWGFDPGLYLPLFDFARLYRLPMTALNVERSLVSRVGQEGWAAVPAEEREGVGDPAAASGAYRRSLAEVYSSHIPRPKAEEGEESEPPSLEEVMAKPEFGRFVEAQLTWDRAMAEALAGAHQSNGRPTVVGIVGSGHLERRHGIPHQLSDMGISNVAVLLPLSPDRACESLEPGLADAVFVAESRAEPKAAKPRLGVFIETGEAGVTIMRVSEGSVAEATGLKAGDILVEAAGFPLKRQQELIEIIGRQAPGTWLPLTVEREGKTSEMIAKFPKVFE